MLGTKQDMDKLEVDLMYGGVALFQDCDGMNIFMLCVGCIA